MSDFITVARPYARAAFEYAQAHKAVSAWSESLGLLAAVAKDHTVEALLDNPGLSREQRAELLIRICGDKLDQAGKNLIRLLAENGRLKALPEIAEQYEVYRAELEGTVEATLLSAQAVSREQLAKVAKALEARFGKKVNLQSEVDESLIGGAIIKAGDMVIDGSLKSRLEKLSAAISR